MPLLRHVVCCPPKQATLLTFYAVFTCAFVVVGSLLYPPAALAPEPSGRPLIGYVFEWLRLCFDPHNFSHGTGAPSLVLLGAFLYRRWFEHKLVLAPPALLAMPTADEPARPDSLACDMLTRTS